MSELNGSILITSPTNPPFDTKITQKEYYLSKTKYLKYKSSNEGDQATLYLKDNQSTHEGPKCMGLGNELEVASELIPFTYEGKTLQEIIEIPLKNKDKVTKRRREYIKEKCNIYAVKNSETGKTMLSNYNSDDNNSTVTTCINSVRRDTFFNCNRGQLITKKCRFHTRRFNPVNTNFKVCRSWEFESDDINFNGFRKTSDKLSYCWFVKYTNASIFPHFKGNAAFRFCISTAWDSDHKTFVVDFESEDPNTNIDSYVLLTTLYADMIDRQLQETGKITVEDIDEFQIVDHPTFDTVEDNNEDTKASEQFAHFLIDATLEHMKKFPERLPVYHFDDSILHISGKCSVLEYMKQPRKITEESFEEVVNADEHFSKRACEDEEEDLSKKLKV